MPETYECPAGGYHVWMGTTRQGQMMCSKCGLYR